MLGSQHFGGSDASKYRGTVRGGFGVLFGGLSTGSRGLSPKHPRRESLGCGWERAFCVYAGLRHLLYLDFMQTLAKGA